MEDVDTKLNLATKFKCHDVVIDVSPSEMRPLSESSVGSGRLQRQGLDPEVLMSVSTQCSVVWQELVWRPALLYNLPSSLTGFSLVL